MPNGHFAIFWDLESLQGQASLLGEEQGERGEEVAAAVAAAATAVLVVQDGKIGPQPPTALLLLLHMIWPMLEQRDLTGFVAQWAKLSIHRLRLIIY